MKKVNAVRPKNENNFLRLLLSLKLAEYKIAVESFSEIVFFLVQYSFLFEDTEKVLNSCGTEQSQLYALQENRGYGARYLDPKYSMWLSTDPALSDYMAGSSAGCGGVFNPVNFNLYHYGGNNPVRYSDPTGLFDFDTNTIEEGDTLSQIAKDCNTRYGTNYTADDLQGLNSDTITDKDKIYAGNHLNLGKAEDVQKRAADYTSRATTQYSNEQVTPPKKINQGDFTVGLNLNFVPCIGIDVSLGFVFDLDNSGASGLFLSGGFASGASVGGSVFAGYTKGDFEDSNIATLSAGYGLFGGSVGFADNGNISFSGGLSFGLKAGFNISKQHGFVIPFDTPAEREKSMERYYMHH